LFTQIIVTFFSGGLGAGIVTFVLNSLKADRDFLRTKLETLYLSVDAWTEHSTQVSALLMTGNLKELEELSKENPAIFGHIGQMIVIIDLYFPQLQPAYDKFFNLVSDTNVKKAQLKKGQVNNSIVGERISRFSWIVDLSLFHSPLARKIDSSTVRLV
jgi:hypothetical protein